MKQAYEKPNMAWIDFNHTERIAASGGTGGGNGNCSIIITSSGSSGCPSPYQTNIVAP